MERYTCGSKSLGPGASETQALRFRIDEVPAGTGQVKAVLKGGYAERDSGKGNNVAEIAVNVTGAGDGVVRDADGGGDGSAGSLAAGAGTVGVLTVAAAVGYGIRRSRHSDRRG